MSDTYSACEALAAEVHQAQAGDTAAVTGLYLRFQPKITAYFRYHLMGTAHAHRADDLADDLSGDVFVRLCEKIDTYRPRDGVPFPAWLYRIAHNRLVDFLRRRRLPSVSLAVLAESGCIEPVDSRAERAFAAADRATELDAAYARLTGEQRAALHHRVVCDRSLRQTAQIMRKSEDSVKQLQFRALARLRKELEGAVEARSARSARPGTRRQARARRAL
jgi:RNA polymerase sigma-70 factor, ECF subfamily